VTPSHLLPLDTGSQGATFWMLGGVPGGKVIP